MHALVFLSNLLADQEVPTKVLGFHAAEVRQNQRIDPGTQGELQPESFDGGACLLEILIHPQCVHFAVKKGIVFKKQTQRPMHNLLNFCEAKEAA